MSDSEQGTLYGIGAGPGDPRLLTMWAVEVLRFVPVVFAAGSTQNDYSLVLDSVPKDLLKETEIRTLQFPMTSNPHVLSSAWEDNAREVLKVLESGRNAAFLTIGDPLTYSTYGYLVRTITSMAPGIRIVTIPGITSYHAAAARINRPLAEGRESLLVLPGVRDRGHLEEMIDRADQLVILKAGRNIGMISEVLSDKAPDREVVLVSCLGMVEERIETVIRSLDNDKIPYLSLLLIKKPTS